MISPDYPFEPNYRSVLGSRMHYVDTGSGDPVLFLHGNPTSSYLWRNIIPYLSDRARCIAPDLIGMGRSDKPDLDYDFFDHYRYLEQFIDELELDNILLVVHDWGSALGFHYAVNHPGRVRGIAFMEALYRPWSWNELSPGYRTMFRLMRAPLIGWTLLQAANLFVTKVLPENVIRDLTPEELQRYAEPYDTIRSRKPVHAWPSQVPFDGRPAGVHRVISEYHDWLKESDIPKLCLFGPPGAIIQREDVEWISANFSGCQVREVGSALHYLQEDQPDRIGQCLQEWLERL